MAGQEVEVSEHESLTSADWADHSGGQWRPGAGWLAVAEAASQEPGSSQVVAKRWPARQLAKRQPGSQPRGQVVAKRRPARQPAKRQMSIPETRHQKPARGSQMPGAAVAASIHVIKVNASSLQEAAGDKTGLEDVQQFELENPACADGSPVTSWQFNKVKEPADN